MPKIELLDASKIEASDLDAFLRQVYTPRHCRFLREHGEWWHRGNSNRLVILVDGTMAGYCSLIPANIRVGERVHPALWWVDLIIKPEFRGRGLQSRFDQHVRGSASLLLGFPNDIAGRIHRKHGWGVREDERMILLPLIPSQIRMVRSAKGLPGGLLRVGTTVLDPLAATWKRRITNLSANTARRISSVDGSILSEIFQRNVSAGCNTTWRDEAYFDWRYKNAPKPEEYSCYVSGPESPTHYIIARHVLRDDGFKGTRILDLFGDFRDHAAIQGLLISAIREAVAHGSSQVTLMASDPNLRDTARQLGFIISRRFGFCWWSEKPDLMDAFGKNNYWTLGDSDNDAPD